MHLVGDGRRGLRGTPGTGGPLGRAGEVVEVRGLVLIQAQCPGEGVEDIVGRPNTSINSKLAISRERFLCYLSTGATNG